MHKKNLAFLLLALLVAALAQASFVGPSSGSAWIIFAVAAILVAVGAAGYEGGRFAGGHARNAPPRLPAFSRWRLILGLLSLISAGGALALFAGDRHQGAAWGLHLLSLLLFLSVFTRRPEWKPGDWRPLPLLRRYSVEFLFLLGVLGLAAFARWWQLSTFPFGTWTDEAVHGLYAMDMLQDPGYRPVYLPDTNHPSHFVFLIAGAFRLFGVSTFSMRLVAAGLSLATVGLAYLVFRRWFGVRLALLAAAMLAVMRYDLTFSRFAHHGISTPFFILLSLYFLDRALDTKDTSNFAWLGLSLGVGLAFYQPLRLLPFILVAFLVLAWAWAVKEGGWKKAFGRYVASLRLHWLIALAGVLLATAPIVQYAALKPAIFFARSNQVSIFTNRSEPDLGKALWNNTRKHLQMFNVHGDPNGRHNLPNSPMLDPVMGVLLVLGVTIAITKWRNPLNILMLMLFFGMLLGGILSLDFEAPQSLRSIGVIPSLIYFMVLPIEAVLGAAEGALHPSARTARSTKAKRRQVVLNVVMAVVLTGLAAAMTDLNFVTFFVKQRNDPGVWGSYSTQETIVAGELNRYAAGYDFLVSALYDQNPTTRFLAGRVTNVKRWTAVDHLPVPGTPPGRGLILLADRLLDSAYNEAVRLYPEATVVDFHAPTGGDTVLREVIIPAAQLTALHGLTADYTDGSGAVAEEHLEQAYLDWTQKPPFPAPFTAILRGTILVPDYGSYRFNLVGTLPAALLIDGYPVSSESTTLARGLHDLRIEVQGDQGTLEMQWQTPGETEFVSVPDSVLFLPSVPNAGLRGEYYSSPDWSGQPEMVQLDPQLEYYYHVTPLKRPYSVQWSGALFAPDSGSYKFALYSIDGSSLSLDGKLVVTNPDGGSTTDGETQLSEGWHEVVVRFTDKTGGTRIYLYWTPPGTQDRQIVPARYLRPPMGTLPSTP